jgi:glycosyltransferase involved in cell wall biosynthesis
LILDQYSEIDSDQWIILNKKPGKFDFNLLLQLLKLLKQKKIEIVHTHCEASALYAGIACKLKNIPILGTYHRSELAYYQPTLKNKLYARLLDHCIAISHERKVRMVEQLGIVNKKITIIHGGIELADAPIIKSKEALKQQLGICGTILFSAGHLGPIKGHDDSIMALLELKNNAPEQAKDTQLYIAGDGSKQDYTRLNTLIKKHTLESQVTLLGHTTNTISWMQACDIFLLPPLEEGFGLVFIEAGLCSKPTISTNVGGIPDIIINNKTGYLVEANAPQQIAQKLATLIGNPEKSKRLGDNAHKRTLKHFLMSEQTKKLEQVYRDLM